MKKEHVSIKQRRATNETLTPNYKQKETIAVEDNVYLPVGRHNDIEHRHKLATVVAQPYHVKKLKNKTIVIKQDDNTVERVSCYCATHMPIQRTAKKLQASTRPMRAEELTCIRFSSRAFLAARDI